VLDTLFHALIRYAAPVMVFTSEEVWGTRYPDDGSVHLLEWPEIPEATVDSDRWEAVRKWRDTVNEAIEPLRRDKILGSSLEAQVSLLAPETLKDRLSGLDLGELFISANVTIEPKRGVEAEVHVTRSSNHKCGRCWRLLPEVTADGGLCNRCEDAVAQLDTAA